MITAIAEHHGRTPAQVILRGHIDGGRSAIPKSVRPERIAENLDVFGFSLSPDEVAAIDALDTGVRGGPNGARARLPDVQPNDPGGMTMQTRTLGQGLTFSAIGLGCMGEDHRGLATQITPGWLSMAPPVTSRGRCRRGVVVRDSDVEDEEHDEDERERSSGADPGRAVDVGPAAVRRIVAPLIAHAGAVGRSTHRRAGGAPSGRGRCP